MPWRKVFRVVCGCGKISIHVVRCDVGLGRGGLVCLGVAASARMGVDLFVGMQCRFLRLRTL